MEWGEWCMKYMLLGLLPAAKRRPGHLGSGRLFGKIRLYRPLFISEQGVRRHVNPPISVHFLQLHYYAFVGPLTVRLRDTQPGIACKLKYPIYSRMKTEGSLMKAKNPPPI
ncbi:hypothetical protein A3848_22555 [Paenibacillus sp. P32E]|nr:hypothetical protein A3848_22555 [Paenibacillus sp. P32E]